MSLYYLTFWNSTIFVVNEFFLVSTSSEQQQPMDLKNHDGTQKKKIVFQAQFWSTSNQ